MAMQAGMGFSKIIILIGAGYTGTLMMKNGKLSDVLGELQALVKGYEEKRGDGSDVDHSDAIAAQVRRLAMEVRQMASSRQITVLNGGPGGNVTSLVVPAAALGAVGYGYMWWKGVSFSDLMYVTKQNMSNAVSNLTKHLDHVSDALALIMNMVLKELTESFRFACTLSFWRMVFLWTFPLIFSYIRLFTQNIFTKKLVYRRFPVSHFPTEIGRQAPVCIITGATSGLGAAAALALSREGFFVIIAGRSPHKLSKVMSDIRRQSKEANVEAFQVDLSSFSSIMSFKEYLVKWFLDSNLHPSIQLLINNAGILATESRLTTEGHDRMMGTNYIGAFSLTKVLLPLLKNSPVPSRIINLTSFTHRNVSSFQVEKEIVSGNRFSEYKHYPCAEIYEYSKLCILLFSYELHRQFHLTAGSQPISVMAVDPGAVKTNIMLEVPWCISQTAFAVLWFLGLLQSPEAGVSSIVDAALAPLETSGLYFFGGKGRTIDSSKLSYDIKLSRELWDTSCDIFQDSLLLYSKVSKVSVSSEKDD